MIRVYSLDEATEWDGIVSSFENYDIYYLSGYVNAFKINGDGEPLLYYYENDNTRAINVIIKRDISKSGNFSKVNANTYFDFITPYGYGGWLVEGDDYEGLARDYEATCIENNIISEFVRFNPMIKNHIGIENMYEQVCLGHTVYMDTIDKEVIWQNLTSKNRNMIRKAQKNGLEVFWGRDSSLIPVFMKIYNETMDKDKAESYYYFEYDFYESILNDLKQNAMWFYVKHDGEIIAMAIFLFCNGKMHYHLSASKREFQYLAPTNLLIYEAAIWAASHGYKKMHLGGGVGASNDSLYSFKKSFNRGEDIEFFIGKKIFCNEIYSRLEAMHIKDNPEKQQSRFFPKYRA